MGRGDEVSEMLTFGLISQNKIRYNVSRCQWEKKTEAEKQIERQTEIICLCVSVDADEGRTENILRT